MLYIYIGLITNSPISMIYLLESVWQQNVQHIGMRYWSNTDVLVMALPRGHANNAKFCHDNLIVSNILANTGHCVGHSVVTLTQHIQANTWPNAATEMTHRLQRRPSICLASGSCFVFAGLIFTTAVYEVTVTLI